MITRQQKKRAPPQGLVVCPFDGAKVKRFSCRFTDLQKKTDFLQKKTDLPSNRGFLLNFHECIKHGVV